LYDTYGIPRDFIEDMVEDRRLTLDVKGFERAMEGQREKARAKSTFKGGAAAADKPWSVPDGVAAELKTLPDQFLGYDQTAATANIVALFRDTGERNEYVMALKQGDDGFVALSQTPFYLEAGGQVSDIGRLVGPKGEAQVRSVSRQPQLGPRLHGVTVTGGLLSLRDIVSAEVTGAERAATRRNHTATHLLHAALRQVLGPHVKQAGSLVAPDRLRFDFVHFAALTRDQLLDIERIVNERILENTPVQTDLRNTQEAIASGAMALFGEKYGDKVRVVSIPGFSVELCGGTHVSATGDIGLFAIVSEGGVAAGVRRIDAITGLDSLKAFQRDRDQLAETASALNARPGEIVARVTALQEETKRLTRDLQQARMKAAMGGGAAEGQDEAIEVAGVKLVAREVSGLDKEGLRALVDRHRDRIKSGVVVLAAGSDGKVSLVVGVTPDLTKRVPAGQVVKQLAPIVGGGGGGRPDFAEAGGKDPSKIDDALAASRGIVEKLLAGGG
jgi:alanyl-tRNA synthetase